MKQIFSKNYLYKVFIFFIMVIVFAFSGSLSIKANVGLGAWDAVSRSLSYVTSIKIGTLIMILNALCVLGQIILLRSKFNWINILQFAVSFTVGTFFNFFYYDVLAAFDTEQYMVRVLMLVVACVLMAMSLSIIVTLDVIGMPVEFFCAAIARVLDMDFGKVRQYYDFVTMALVIILTLIFKTPLTIREGTLIIALLLGPMITFFIPYAESLLIKIGAIQ
ncbi:YczE/YyaS/YitT family protein [Allofustis seminis]|uniref:YczE/YyaS/YitT family protein n=1 Tax=Allofustis seminis TaxID=166939 RepID=UPI00037C72B7|nr:hypothetical protein [Allofustis seminis]